MYTIDELVTLLEPPILNNHTAETFSEAALPILQAHLASVTSEDIDEAIDLWDQAVTILIQRHSLKRD